MPTAPKTPFKNITDARNADTKIAAEDDAGDDPNTADSDAGYKDFKTFPYSFRNRKHTLDAADADAAP